MAFGAKLFGFKGIYEVIDRGNQQGLRLAAGSLKEIR